MDGERREDVYRGCSSFPPTLLPECIAFEADQIDGDPIKYGACKEVCQGKPGIVNNNIFICFYEKVKTNQTVILIPKFGKKYLIADHDD